MTATRRRCRVGRARRRRRGGVRREHVEGTHALDATTSRADRGHEPAFATTARSRAHTCDGRERARRSPGAPSRRSEVGGGGRRRSRRAGRRLPALARGRTAARPGSVPSRAPGVSELDNTGGTRGWTRRARPPGARTTTASPCTRCDYVCADDGDARTDPLLAPGLEQPWPRSGTRPSPKACSSARIDGEWRRRRVGCARWRRRRSAAPRAALTSNFGVGKRESHDATAFYERFEAPDALGRRRRSSRRTRSPSRSSHGDARHMDAILDNSVALVVTSPPYFAGKQYEEELERDGVPSSYVEYLAAAHRRVRRVRAQARAGRPHRGQRREPRPQAVPQPRGRRRSASSRTTCTCCCGARSSGARAKARPATARGDRSAAPANPVLRDIDRARRHREQGPLRPRA